MFFKDLIKHVPAALGGLLALASLIFFARAVIEAGNDIDAGRIDTRLIAITSLIALLYAAAQIFLALGWRRFLYQAHSKPLDGIKPVAIYAIAQFAKYVPGNIFHFAGRHTLLKRRGVAHKALLLSTLNENVAQLVSAILVGSALLIAFPPTAMIHYLGTESLLEAHQLRVASLPLAMLWITASTLAAALLLKSVFRARFLPSLLLDGTFYVLQAVLFLALFFTLSGEFLPSVLGLVTLSWIAGFITPGAPGGIGVREVILLYFLKDMTPDADILLSIALYRVATFAGDALFFAGGLLLSRQKISAKKGRLSTHDG